MGQYDPGCGRAALHEGRGGSAVGALVNQTEEAGIPTSLPGSLAELVRA